MGTTTSHPAQKKQTTKKCRAPIMSGVREKPSNAQGCEPQEMDAVSKKVTELSLNKCSDSQDAGQPSKGGIYYQKKIDIIAA